MRIRLGISIHLLNYRRKFDAETTEKELLIINILDILKRYVGPTRLSELNAYLPEHPEKLRVTDYADIIIFAPIAFTERGRLLECLSGHMAYSKEAELIRDLRRQSYEDERKKQSEINRISTK